jgi:formylglycine-generating enzyme required for sulfatase activity
MQEGLTPVYSINGITNPNNWGARPWDNIIMNNYANGYRLPTEAEWEYAARGGSGSPGNFIYSGSNNVDDVAWYNLNSGSQTHPVGTLRANQLGIYDMNGNVSEWCWDWFGAYSAGAEFNPTGISFGTQRVRRGGAWNNNNTNVRNVIRNSNTPDTATYVIGFRVVRLPD